MMPGVPKRRKHDSNPIGIVVLGTALCVGALLLAHPAVLVAVVLIPCSMFGAWLAYRRSRSKRRYEAYRQRQIERHRYEIEAQQELKDWLAMTPTEFEYAVANLCADLGHTNVQRIGRSGDRAADITFTDASDGGFSVIQCKRYAPGQKVGSRDIQAFIGMAYAEHDAVHAIFITTADFTAEATALGERHGIRLLNGVDLVELSRARLREQPQHQPPRPDL